MLSNNYALSKFDHYSNFKSMYYIGLSYIREDCINTNIATQLKYHTCCPRQPSYVWTNLKNALL